MSEQELSLADRIKELTDNTIAEDANAYLTVKSAARQLDVKQTDVRDNLPEGYGLEPSQNGTLSESRIKPGFTDKVIVTQSENVPTAPPKKKEGKKVSDAQKEVVTSENGEEGASVETTAAETVELEVCTICGNKVRKSTMTRRGICPLCFAEMSRQSKINQKKLLEMPDEEFLAVVGNEVARRQEMVDYRASRTLTKEEFEERKDGLIPVKELFAAAKEAGIGQGRVASAVGGDRLRHEPVGGFGSIWTPFYYGARNAWYFDNATLENLDQLRRPVKEKAPKKERAAKGGRTEARGAVMTPVADDEGVPADADTAEMASTPS